MATHIHSPRGHVVMSLGIKGGISRLSCVSRALPIIPSIHVIGCDVTQGPGTGLCYLIGWSSMGRAQTNAARTDCKVKTSSVDNHINNKGIDVPRALCSLPATHFHQFSAS